MPKCTKGKSCGATCVERQDVCRLELPKATSTSIKKATVAVTSSKISTEGREGIKAAKVFDSKFKPVTALEGTQKDYNWDPSLAGVQHGSKGAYGSVLLYKDKVVKRGELGADEAKAVLKLGQLDLGPKLISAELGSRIREDYGSDIYGGRIAMTRVPGKELREFSNSKDKVNGVEVGDSFWKARADLHRSGIAHNDQHHGNVLIDDKGKVRFVDLGLAQMNPKSAMAEALGIFANKEDLPLGVVVTKQRPWGDHMVVKKIGGKIMFPAFGTLEPAENQPKNLKTVRGNKAKVFSFLREKGFSNDDIAFMVTSGIRQSRKNFEQGPWAKLSNKDAEKVVELLYKGIQ